MAHLPALKHRVQVSLTNQDSTSAETTGQLFKVGIGAGNTPTHGGEEYVDDQELGNDTFAPEDAPEELTKTWSKTIEQPAADNAFLTFGLFAAGNGGAASTEHNVNSQTNYRAQTWSGGFPSAGDTPFAFTVEDVGDPDNEDDAKNELVHAVVVSSFRMGSGNGSPVSASMTLLGGGLTAALGGAPTSRTSYRHARFTHKHVQLVTSDTTGLGTPTAMKAIIENAPSAANATTYSGLAAGTLANWTDLIDAWELVIDTEYDVAASRMMSTGYVPHSGAWRVAGQTANLTLTFKDGASEVGTLRTEYQNKTARPFELKMIHPTALTTGVYPGIVCEFGKMYPVADSWQPANAGRGAKTVAVTYRAYNDGTRDWRMMGYSGTGASSLVLGG